MALQSAFVTAISGLNGTGRALSEIGNNIANAETVGYKSSRVNFGDLFGATIGAGGTSTSLQEGRGVSVLGIDKNFTQGSLRTTSNALDLAIDGDGFFLVEDAAGNPFYTRNGQFGLNSAGEIVNSKGLMLQGFQADSTGTILGTVGDIVLTTSQVAASPTANINMSGNLQSDETATTFNINNLTGSTNFSTGVRMFDSLGNGHDVTLYFTKTATNTWSYYVVAPASDVTVDASALDALAENALVASGTLTFTTNGALDTESAVTYYDASSPSGPGIDFTGGATADQTLAFGFGTSITTDSGTGLDGITQFGSPSVTLTLGQDGFASGTLKGSTIDEDGTIVGQFSNGTVRNLGQVILARFVSPDGLGSVGGNLFIETNGSGSPLSGAPKTGAFGSVIGNTLELANVDLGDELVNMITMQRAFQANSRVITTTNDLLGELVNLSR
jgi:flagellar hook protein FlgE